jgi:hypothetical protein
MMKKILLSFILTLFLLPVLANAMLITNWRSNRGIVHEGDEIIFSVDVISDNSITRVFVELIKTNPTNTTTSYVDLSLIGSPTSGTWIKFFKESQGVYEISKINAIDNTSANASIFVRDYGFFGFEFLPPLTTTTLTTTTHSTTTSIATTVVQTTTSSTTTAVVSAINDTNSNTTYKSKIGSVIQTILSNPLYLIIIIVAAVVPIVMLLFLLK